MRLYEEIELSKTELDILVEAMSNPVVVKYIRGLAQVLTESIATSYLVNPPVNGQPVDLVAPALRLSFLQGGISFADELLANVVKVSTVNP